MKRPNRKSLNIRAGKTGVAVDFRSPERLSDNRTMSYGSASIAVARPSGRACRRTDALPDGRATAPLTMETRSLSHSKQGGTDEIHLFGIHRARKIRRDDRGRATGNVRRLL